MSAARTAASRRLQRSCSALRWPGAWRTWQCFEYSPTVQDFAREQLAFMLQSILEPRKRRRYARYLKTGKTEA